MVFCGESIITEISVYVSFYMSEFIIQSTIFFQRVGIAIPIKTGETIRFEISMHLDTPCRIMQKAACTAALQVI